MTDYNKYIKSAGTHYISNSGHDENGKYKNGKAGDQTGEEWSLRSWYNRPWSCVLRWPDQSVAQKFAELGILAPLNNKIGYDQYQRKTYWSRLEKAGYDPSKITTACEEDCTAGVTANCKAVGYLLGIEKLKALALDTYSGNMKSRFKAAGFSVLTASKYLSGVDYLLPGDVLLYEGHHAAMNITLGKKAGVWNPSNKEESFAVLKKGMEGAAVRTMQENLITIGYSLPIYGADGDFGDETLTALKAFQRDNGLDADGEYGEKTDAAMRKKIDDLAPKVVHVTGGSVNIRSAPTKESESIGIAHSGDILDYQGLEQDGWYLIVYKGVNAWISKKYSEVKTK